MCQMSWTVVANAQVCESLAVSAGVQEKGAIGAMFEREMKQEKNLEVILQSVMG